VSTGILFFWAEPAEGTEGKKRKILVDGDRTENMIGDEVEGGRWLINDNVI